MNAPVDAFWDSWDSLQQRGGAPVDVTELTACPLALPDGENIAPREWLYGHRLIRRFVSVLAAPGGVGKSALALAQAVAVAVGKPLLGERIHARVPVWLLNLEDPLEELHRRLAAFLRLHALDRAELDGFFYLHSGRDRRVIMAELDAAGVVHPDRDALIAAAKARGIGLIVVDPFVKSHRLNENDNILIDAAATAWAEVAQATGAAILLVHHVRKGAAGDIDAARGAKALTDAARSASLLSPMTSEEAEEFALPAGERWRFVRLDDAKANLAPRATAARWYRLGTVALGNATEAYPEGDHVAAVTAWTPPSPLADLSPADCNQALDELAAGPGGGLAYLAKPSSKAPHRWGGRVLTRFGLTDAQAARVLALWLRSGLLAEQSYRDAANRPHRLGLRVVDARRPTASPQNMEI